MRAYSFALRWIMTNLPDKDPNIARKIHAGDCSSSTWPNGGSVSRDDARDLAERFLRELHEAVCVPPDANQDGKRTCQVVRRLLLRFHVDKAGSDYRSRYAHLAISALVDLSTGRSRVIIISCPI